ncbi:MAG: dTDP-4-dehydrorhamnose reductase [Ilumatobacteraceae bacterium]
MRVLITGAGGQLGTDLALACSAAGDEVAAYHRVQLDITSRDDCHGAITSTLPDVVFHTGAWTAVDACEGNPERALLTNGLAVRWMAEACNRAGAHLVHVSTDYVFDGTLDRPYDEWDEPNPQSVYGRSKLVGEHEAAALGPAAAIVRTSWVCGQYGNNMVKTVMRLAAEHPALSFVDDQHGHPTFTADLAPLLRRIGLDRRSGVIHATNQGATTWHEFAQAVVAAMGNDPAMVAPISSAELQPRRPAPRPANSVLDNAVLRHAGVPLLRDFHEPLAELVAVLT